MRLKDMLAKHPKLGGAGYLVLPLHSLVPGPEQRRAFVRPPAGVRKARPRHVALISEQAWR